MDEILSLPGKLEYLFNYDTTSLLSIPFIILSLESWDITMALFDSTFMDMHTYIKEAAAIHSSVLVHLNVSVGIHSRKKTSLHIHNTYCSNVLFFLLLLFVSLFVEMAKVKQMQLLNKDCVLDILQGHLNLGIADDLVQTEIDESTCSHFSECSTMNW